jgi:hypothetical protein
MLDPAAPRFKESAIEEFLDPREPYYRPVGDELELQLRDRVASTQAPLMP